MIEPGVALHEMLLRVTINDKFLIEDIEAATDNSPFAMCPEIAADYKKLIGVTMGPGWRGMIRSRMGGVKGCTHLTELLYPMATVAIQTIRPLQNHRRRQADSDSRHSAGKPFVLNTCHAWAAGERLVDAVDRILAITGRIDLVHCNDSRDAAGSGADRHANFGTGQIDPQLLVAVVKAAGAPVIIETADDGRREDIAFLRDNL
jgi:hypothetical protein